MSDNPLLSPFTRPFGGVQVIETLTAVKKIEDWSRCRSPSRAYRRRKAGHRQNIVVHEEPCAYQFLGKLFIHPVLYAKLRHGLNTAKEEK